MNPALLAALIQQLGLPELIRWLASKRAAGQIVTDRDAIEKLEMDGTAAVAQGDEFLRETDPNVNPPPVSATVPD